MSKIIQSGKRNTNIYVENGTVNNINDKVCSLSFTEICEEFSLASIDLKEHKGYFGKNLTSKIIRNEVNEIENWINCDLKDNENPILVIAGQAGYGKSVILQQLYNSLKERNIPVLGIKSDKIIVDNADELTKELGLDFSIEELVKTLTLDAEKVIVIIDQIDALSQYLSSNRNPLNTYNRLIQRLKYLPNVRIVVSCRTFDLDFDPSLKSYNNLRKIIIGKLNEKDVKSILSQLEIDFTQFSPSFLSFLAIPVHLEIYSIVYRKDIRKEFSSLQELYSEYWNQKILNSSGKGKEIVKLVFDLSEKMFQEQQITIDKRRFEDSYNNELNYLLSEGVIVCQGNKIQFVHQSFFDYTSARHFVSNNHSISVHVLEKGKHQGLFIRSGLRHVLLYLREVRYSDYIKELQTLFASDELRFHLKLLLVSILGYIEDPKVLEKQLIQELKEKDELLFKCFLESANEGCWFRFLFETMYIANELQTNYNEYVNHVFQLLIRTLDKSPELAINYVESLPDFQDKRKFVSRILFFVKDFSNKKFLDLFEQYAVPSETHDYFHFLERALVIHPDWVISKLELYFETSEKRGVQELFSGHHEEEQVYKELLKKHKGKAIEFFFDLLLKSNGSYQQALAKSNIFSYSSGYGFMFYVPHKKDNYSGELQYFLCDSIIDYLQDEYSNNPIKTKEYINRLTGTKSLTLHSLVIPTYLKYANLLVDDIFTYLNSYSDLFVYYTHCELYEYYFRNLIRLVYTYLSDDQKQAIDNYILNAVSEEEKTKSVYYRKGVNPKGMNWYGITKYKLLSEIPQEYIQRNSILLKEFKEYKRKFGEVPSRMPEGIVVRSGERTMPAMAYSYMSIENWKNSFKTYTVNNYAPWEDRPSEIGHNRKFEELCKTQPERHINILEALIQDKTVPVSAIVYGFSGLTQSKYQVEIIAVLFIKFLDSRKEDLREFPLQMTVWFTNYFIKNKAIPDVIVNFLCEVIRTESDGNERHNDLVNDGINSIRGAAVDRLVTCYEFYQYEELIFSTLEYVAKNANAVTRASAVFKLAFLNNLNKERNLDLYLSLISDYHPGLLSIPLSDLHPLVYLIHVDFEKLIPFFKKAIEIEEAHKPISHILLFAWLNGYDGSKPLLDLILSRSNIAKKTVVDVSFQNLEDDKSFQKCYELIMKFLEENDAQIADEYDSSFYHLKPEIFPKIEEYLFKYAQSKTGQKKQHRFYHFLQDCIKYYQTKLIAEKCIALSQLHNNNSKQENGDLYSSQEPLQVVLDSYYLIREYSEKTPSLELAMDVFDSMLKLPEYRGNLNRMLNSLDASVL